MLRCTDQTTQPNPDLTPMWEALAAHQPIADALGYGEAWAKMCVDKTKKTAEDAEDAAATVDAGWAAYAAWNAATADADAAKTAKYITKANDVSIYINNCIGETK